MRQIGIFGGSFNPIQTADIAMAKMAHAQLGLDKVWLMPTIQNPLKLVTGMESFQDRYQMCRLAIEGHDEWLEVTDFEGIINENRTIHVLRALKTAHPDCRFYLVNDSG